MSSSKQRLWLVKSEPNAFSWQDLWKSPGRRTCWDGIRNYQVRNFIRDDMKKGDLLLFYHSNAKPPGVVGFARVVREAYPDHTQFDPKDGHYDPKSDPAEPRWLMFDLKAERALPEFVSLNDLKANARLSKMLVVQRGQRLSIQPVTQKEWDEVLRMGGLEAAV
jgi:predicted RNA-binding protein with PUA-like domain